MEEVRKRLRRYMSDRMNPRRAVALTAQLHRSSGAGSQERRQLAALRAGYEPRHRRAAPIPRRSCLSPCLQSSVYTAYHGRRFKDDRSACMSSTIGLHSTDGECHTKKASIRYGYRTTRVAAGPPCSSAGWPSAAADRSRCMVSTWKTDGTCRRQLSAVRRWPPPRLHVPDRDLERR